MSDIVKVDRLVKTFRASYTGKFKGQQPDKEAFLVVEFSKYAIEAPEEAMVEVRIELKKDDKFEPILILNDEEAGQALLNHFFSTAIPATPPEPKQEQKLQNEAGLI